MEPPPDPILRLDPGNMNVLRETEPGTVEVRYRGLRRLSARDLIREANAAWYVVFENERGMTLTLTNGAAAPKQENIVREDANAANRRGTLEVMNGKSLNLTGVFASEWLSDSQHLDIVIEQEQFHFLQLKQPLFSLRKHRPDLFSRTPADRVRKPDRIGRREALKSARGARRR